MESIQSIRIFDLSKTKNMITTKGQTKKEILRKIEYHESGLKECIKTIRDVVTGCTADVWAKEQKTRHEKALIHFRGLL